MKTVIRWIAGLLAIVSVELTTSPLAAQDDVPEVVRERLEEADRHRQAGRFEQAIESYVEARRLGPGVLEVYASLGALYAGRNDFEQALEAFSAGLELSPDDRQLLFNAAVAAMRLERFGAALGHVDRALARHRSDADLHSLRGAILTRLERPQEALAALEQAAKRKSGDPQILFRIGNLHHELGQKEQAVVAFRKAIKKDRSLLRAFYNLGAVLVELGRYDEALDAYTTALAPLEQAFADGKPVESIHARAYQNLGAIYFQKQDWRRSLDAYEKALRLDPNLSGALYNQGFIHFTLGDLEAAERSYRAALGHDAELPLAYLHLGRIEAQRGDLEASVKTLTDGLTRLDGAHRLDALRTLADSQRRLQRPDEAERAYRAVLEVDPEDLMARLALGQLLRRAGHLEEARRELEQVRRQAPDQMVAGLELAALARSQGRTADERALYEGLLRSGDAGNGLWPVRLNLALLLLRQGETADARPHLERLAERADDLPGVRERQLINTLQALLLALDGDRDGSQQRLQSVLAEGTFPAAADVLAVLEISADPAAALSALADSVPRWPSEALQAVAQANLGQALWLAGRSEEAREPLEVAAMAYPQWLSVQAALGDVELRERRYDDALSRLSAAAQLCEAGDGSMPIAPDGFFSTTIGSTSADPTLCQRLRVSLGLAAVGSALERLTPALSSDRGLAAVGQLADRALAQPLPPRPQAIAHFVRGSTRLALGSDEAARRDLRQALAGELPADLRPRANNNLGIALARLGRIDEAQSAYEAASPAYLEATLNLGILFEEQAGDPSAALEQYRSYRAAGGQRREVDAWIERLGRIYH